MRTSGLISGLLILLLAAGAALAKGPLEVATSQAGLVYVEGSVQVRNGAGAWHAAAAGQSLAAGDGLKTAHAAMAVLALADGTNMRISENTEITVVDLAQNGGIVSRFKLSAGQVWSDVHRSGGTRTTYEVQGPDAVAAVKGTSFGVDATGGETLVQVVDGEVACRSGDREETLRPWQQMRAGRGQRPRLSAFNRDTAGPWAGWNIQNRHRLSAILGNRPLAPENRARFMEAMRRGPHPFRHRVHDRRHDPDGEPPGPHRRHPRRPHPIEHE